ncbi:MAG: tetratricopeptide repeat protein [Smithella sp.]
MLNKIAISSGNKKYTYFIIIFLIVTSCAAFGRIASNDFINFDDNKYITENNNIQSGINPESIKWAFTSLDVFYWHPLTWLSHMFDWSLFGANASGHHLVSLLLHIGAVIFLFLFLNKTTNNIWPSAFAAAFFALHPLRVESVAWAAERKDVLSMFFGMVCLYAYAFYAENLKLSRYFLSLILFALALMSKPMMVTLPFILMLLDYWPLGRWQKAMDESARKKFNSARGLIWEKIPFILLTIASSIVTFQGQNKEGAVTPIEALPFLKRGINAIISYIAYLEKTFWPVDLAVFYPYENSLTLWKVIIPGLILMLITVIVIYYIKKLPFLFVGWFWYLGTMIPLIGLIQAGSQAMADRHTYLPSVGIAIMLSWGILYLVKSESIRRKILLPASIAVLAILAVLTWRQCGYWKNSIKLWNHALSVTKNNYIAHVGLGIALFNEGKVKEAIDHYNKVIMMPYQILTFNDDYLYSFYGTIYSNRGKAYTELGLYQFAFEDYNKSIRLNPKNAGLYDNRGLTYYKLDQHQRAIEDFNEAIRLKPDYANYYNDRGNSYNKLSQHQRALDDYTKAIHLKPDYADAYNNRGTTYGKLSQYQRAIEDFNKAIYIKQDYADAYNNRGITYFRQGNNKNGCHDIQKACKLGKCKILEAAKSSGHCR